MDQNKSSNMSINKSFLVIEKIIQYNGSLQIISFALAIDIIINNIFNENLLTFSWSFPSQQLNIGIILLFLAGYSFFMAIVVSIILGFLRLLIFFIKKSKFFMWLKGENDFSLKNGYISVFKLDTIALEEKDDFYKKIVDEHKTCYHKQRAENHKITHITLAVIILIAIDYYFGLNTSNLNIPSITQFIEYKFPLLFKIIEICLALLGIMCILILFEDNDKHDYIYYPSLAQKLQEALIRLLLAISGACCRIQGKRFRALPHHSTPQFISSPRIK